MLMLNFINYLSEQGARPEEYTPNFNSNQMRRSWLESTPGKISSLVSTIIALLPDWDEEYKNKYNNWLLTSNKDYSSTYEKFDDTPCINIASNLTTYYLGKGILKLKTDIDEYQKEESHSLQKYLIKLKEGEPVTIRVYKNSNGKIIYYNKTDQKTVQFIKYLSFVDFLLTSEDELLIELGKKLEEVLENKDTNFEEFIAKIDSKKEENTRKKLDKHIEEMVTKAYTRLKERRLLNLEESVANTKANIKRIMENYTDYLKILDEDLVKLDIIKTENGPDNVYAQYIRALQKMSNGKVYKAPGSNTLYMFIETPLLYTDNDRIKEALNTLKHDKDYIVERLENYSNIHTTTNMGNVFNNLLKKKEIIEYFTDKGKFLNAFIEVMSEIFVEQNILLYMNSLIYWNDESYNNYMIPKGVKVSELESYNNGANKELVVNASKYIWNSHLFSHDCWNRTKIEVVNSVKANNPEDAAQYTLTALQQLTYTDAGSSGTFNMLTGHYRSFREYISKDLSEEVLTKVKAYKKLENNKRATLFELLKEAYDKEEKVEKDKLKDFYTIEEVSVWLEENHTVITSDTAIVACEPKDTTNYMLNGVEHVWITSGDFLTLEKYKEYLNKFKGIQVSPPSNKGEAN